MNTLHAVYENGVFRPLEAVDLPEATEVMLHPRPLHPDDPQSLSPREALRQLQAEARLSPGEAARYLETVRAERQADRSGGPA